jgi:hypothetical protein
MHPRYREDVFGILLGRHFYHVLQFALVGFPSGLSYFECGPLRSRTFTECFEFGRIPAVFQRVHRSVKRSWADVDDAILAALQGQLIHLIGMHRSFREKPEGRNADHWHPEAFALFPSVHIVTALIVALGDRHILSAFPLFQVDYSIWNSPPGIYRLE